MSGIDNLAKILENGNDDEDRCKKCGSLLSVQYVEIRGVNHIASSCSDSECSEHYHKITRRIR